MLSSWLEKKLGRRLPSFSWRISNTIALVIKVVSNPIRSNYPISNPVSPVIKNSVWWPKIIGVVIPVIGRIHPIVGAVIPVIRAVRPVVWRVIPVIRLLRKGERTEKKCKEWGNTDANRLNCHKSPQKLITKAIFCLLKGQRQLNCKKINKFIDLSRTYS